LLGRHVSLSEQPVTLFLDHLLCFSHCDFRSIFC
jgi:hypothetical protein